MSHIGLTILAGAAMAAGAAAGDSDELKTRLSLHNRAFGIYTGKVSASARACTRGRRVIVRHDPDRDGYDPDGFKLGVARTGDDGRYEIAGPQAPPEDRIAARVGGKRRPGRDCADDEVAAPALPIVP